MRCLTVRQPWAWALIHGEKRIENRSRRTRHRSSLLIHAGMSRAELAADYSTLMPGLPPVEALDFGAIIGLVEVYDCVPYEDVCDDPFAEGPWCGLVRNPEPLGPVPWRGALSLFNVDVDSPAFQAALG